MPSEIGWHCFSFSRYVASASYVAKMRGVENVVWEKSQNRQLLRGPACQKKVGGVVRGRHVIKYMTYLYVDVYHGNKLLRIYILTIMTLHVFTYSRTYLPLDTVHEPT